jgi:CheY-like chemotaxis protein
MSAAPFRVIHVDDEENAREQVKELLEGDEEIKARGGVEVISFESFSEALEDLGRNTADIVILDVRDGHGVRDPEPDLAGRRTFEEIRERIFVPVIFYTGFANYIADLKDELKLLRVVEKGNVDLLLEAVRGVLAEGLPTLNRALFGLLREVQRSYMWDFVAPNWPGYRGQDDRVALAHLLVRRFALSLSTDGPESLVRALTGEEGETEDARRADGGPVHPMWMYVMPPLEGARPMAGDVRFGDVEGSERHWVVLTPSCDFAQDRADTVLLAGCELLADQEECRDFLETGSNGKRKKLRNLMCNNGSGRQADRFHFLPGALDFPDLLVDLRALKTVPREDFDGLKPVVSLDAPFAEALLNQFARYAGRLGTPDPDVNSVIDRLESSASS